MTILAPAGLLLLLLPAVSGARALRSALAMNGRNLNLPVQGGHICYDYFPSSSGSPVLYLPSLTRPKNEAKASNLQAWCRKNDHSFLCADYFGVVGI